MMYDMYAWLSKASNIEIQNISPFARRKQLALKVMQSGDAEAKKEAKKEAQRCSIPFWKEFSYISPGMETPFLTTGLALQFSWRLQTPFFSRSESEFDALDNPISRDYLSNNPILKTSGAKGMLANLIKMHDENLAIELFGEKNEEHNEIGKTGSLIIGDVQFSSTGHDVFCPHDRRFGVVDHPVGFEIVPAGSNAEWGIMIPSLTGENRRDKLAFLLKAIQALLFDYGLSAKRSSGYGVAVEDKDVQVTCRIGENIIIPEKYKRVGGHEFSDPEPEKPPKLKNIQNDSVALVRKEKNGEQQMACLREEAYKILYEFQFPTISKKELTKNEIKKLGKQKKAFKAKWQKNDFAQKRWDQCSEIIMAQTNQSSEEIAIQHKAMDEWEARKKYHEEKRPLYYEFTLKQAIKMVENEMEVL